MLSKNTRSFVHHSSLSNLPSSMLNVNQIRGYTMATKQINPKLIEALTNHPISTIPKSPTFKHLGGNYVKLIVDQLKKIEATIYRGFSL